MQEKWDLIDKQQLQKTLDLVSFANNFLLKSLLLTLLVSWFMTTWNTSSFQSMLSILRINAANSC